jgi:predicted dehydrogenase
MRLGLIGTGYWARVVHATSAAAHPDIELVGVWGRNADRATALATDFGIRPYAEPDHLIDDVDALTFAVPPTVQSEIALRAAHKRRHLLLEKPLALSASNAHELERAVTAARVASVVFFTQRFVPATQAWWEQAVATGGWISGHMESTSNIFVPGGPFSESMWRRDHGALWDIGPHALSLMCPVMGDVTAVVAGRGIADQVHLILRHAGGACSTVTVSLTAPEAAVGRVLYFDGVHGRHALPPAAADDGVAVRAHQAALDALVGLADQAYPAHPCDVHFGARVVEVLEAAEQSLSSGCWVEIARSGD